jgi:pyruvate/2-oxoglutarate dehydrogenase complex dihydrolipoamide dehydrogenase (E3) component
MTDFDIADGRIPGCHILAVHAEDLIHEAVVAMNAGDGTLSAITGSIHVHPNTQ